MKIQKEREVERGEFDDKETFATSAYIRNKNKNQNNLEELRRREEKRGQQPSKHIWM